MSPTRIQWLKRIIFVACLFPLASLAARGLYNGLGANPISVITHSTGIWALVFLLITLGVMLVAAPLMRTMGVTGTNVANRLFGVILGALAVQFVLDGIRASF